MYPRPAVPLLAAALALLLGPPAGGQQPPPEQAVRTDLHGDPLPRDASARLGTVRFRTDRPDGFDLSPDGKRLAVTGWRHLRVLDALTGKEVRRLPNPPDGWEEPFRYTRDGRLLRAHVHKPGQGLGTDTTVFLDSASGKVVRLFQRSSKNFAQKHATREAAWSADGRTVATIKSISHRMRRNDDDYDSRVEALGPEGVVLHLWDTTTGRLRREIPLWKDATYGAALSDDGKLVAVWSVSGKPWDQVVLWWDVATGKELHRTRVRWGQLSAGVFSPDGRAIAVGAGEVVVVWDVARGLEVRRLAFGRGRECAYLAFSPDGKLLGAASWEGDVALWETATGKHLGTCRGPRCSFRSLAFPPGGKVLAWGTAEHTVCLWEVPSGKVLTRSEGHRNAVEAVCFSPDGKHVLSASAEGAVCRWDAATGRLIRQTTLALDPTRPGWSVEHPWWRTFTFSPGGKYLVVSPADNGRCRLLQAGDGKPVADLPEPDRSIFSGDSCLAVVDKSGVLHLYDWTARGPARPRQRTVEKVQTVLAVSADGTRVALSEGVLLGKSADGSTHLVRVLEAATGKTVCRFGCWAAELCFSPDGRLLALTEGNGGTRLFDAARGKERLTLAPRRDAGRSLLLFSPDGRMLAAACQAERQGPYRIRVWEAASGGQRCEFTGQEGDVTALAFSPDGHTLASGSRDTTVILWDLGGGPRAAAGGRLTVKERERLWDELGRLDAAAAYRAILRLTADPEGAVRLLGQKLGPQVSDPRGEAERFARRVERLIRRLDSDSFQIRERASEGLEQLGSLARPALEAAVRRRPSLEVRYRIGKLLARLDRPGPDRVLLRPLRAVEVLERVGTPEARQVLRALTRGAPEGRLTQEAKASLARLSRRSAGIP